MLLLFTSNDRISSWMCRSSYSVDIFEQTPSTSELAKKTCHYKTFNFQMLLSKSQEN
jgi:hypothetical protein